MEDNSITWIHDNCVSRIEEAEKLIYTVNLQRKGLLFDIEEKKSDRGREISRLQFLFKEDKVFKYGLVLHKRIIDVLEKAMENPSFADKSYQQTSIQSLLFGQDSNLRKLHFKILHGTYSLAEEKHLLREANRSQQFEAMDSKQDLEDFVSWVFHNRHFYNKAELWLQYMLSLIDELKCTRKKAIASVALKAIIWNTWGPKKAIKEKIKNIEKESDEIKKKMVSLKAEMKRVERCIKATENEIESLWRQVEAASRRKCEIRNCIDELKIIK